MERLLYRPNLFVALGRQNVNGVAHCNPANWYGCSRGQMSAQMNSGMRPYLATLSKTSPVKYSYAGGDKYFVLKHRSHDVRIRSNETAVSDRAAVFRCSTNHRVFHHDAVCSDADLAAVFSDDPGAIKHPGIRANGHVSADGRVVGDRRGRIDGRTLTRVFDNHRALVLSDFISRSRALALLPIGQSFPTQTEWSHKRQVVRANAREWI